jgi:hypothetical protein
MEIRIGAKKSHRSRKNGASREEWEKRKAATNARRGKQVLVSMNVDTESTVVDHSWQRVPND